VAAKFHVGGVYFITAWNAVVLLGTVVGYFEVITGAKGFNVESAEEDGAGERSAVRDVMYDGTDGAGERRANEEEETDPTEITPLIRQRRRIGWPSTKKQHAEGGAIGWWILQLLIVVPAPAILMTHIGVMMIASMSQTLSDGSSPAIGKGYLLVQR
jgi:hypothetical protein